MLRIILICFGLMSAAYAADTYEIKLQEGARLAFGIEGVAKDFPRGYRLILEAAQAGHPVAIYCLACFALQGEGIPEDHTQARILYQQSSDLGYGPGQFNAGIMAKNGDGGPVDNVLAYYDLCLASLNRADLDDLALDAAYYRDEVAPLLNPDERQFVLAKIGRMKING